MKSASQFLVGAAMGLLFASALYYLFEFAFPSRFSDVVVSGVTLIGIGSAIGGYLIRWKGDRSPSTYFVFGFGVGITVVAFLGAGAGVSPAYYG